MTTSHVSSARPERRGDTGITLRAFRLNTAINHIMFTGRRGRVYDRLVVLSGVRPGDSVLDVGSSSGYLASRLAAAGPSVRVTGVDPSEPAIAYARRHAGPGMTFTVGVAQHLPVPDASFDVVTCTLAMHHIPRDQRRTALAEMYRVTKPGGRLLIADFAPHDLEFLRAEHRHRRLGFFDHEMERWLAAAGLTRVAAFALPPAGANGLTVKIWRAEREADRIRRVA